MNENINRYLSLNGMYNIRDLGGYKTSFGTTVPWRKFFRADNPHRLSKKGMSYLYDQGLRLVVDLRTKKEINDAPNPFEHFPSVEFINLPLFDDLSPVLMLQKEVSEENPLLGFYLSAIHKQGNAIRDVLHNISNIENGAVMFNCTAGKDRTGIVAALLLGLVGVSKEEIIYDYTLTASLIPELVKKLLAESRARGANVERHSRMLESPAEVIKEMLIDIENKFGSIEDYLKKIGLKQKEVLKLKQRLADHI